LARGSGGLAWFHEVRGGESFIETAGMERTTEGTPDEMRGRAMRCPRIGCPDALVPLVDVLPSAPTFWVRDDRPGRWSFSTLPPRPFEESESEWAYRCDKCGATFRVVVRVR
jgi:hypothetical protein